MAEAEAAPPEPKPAAAEEEDDNGLAPEEEAQVEFQPVVKLDEVKTATREEDEEVTFKMRAKLFPGSPIRGRRRSRCGRSVARAT